MAEENTQSVEVSDIVAPEAEVETSLPIVVEEPDLQEIPEYFDPTAQKILEYEESNERDGTIYKKLIRRIVDKTPEEIQEEETRNQEQAIAARIRELKYKVAIGTATATEKSDLKILVA